MEDTQDEKPTVAPRSRTPTPRRDEKLASETPRRSSSVGHTSPRRRITPSPQDKQEWVATEAPLFTSQESLNDELDKLLGSSNMFSEEDGNEVGSSRRDCFVHRLDSMIEHAEEMKKKGETEVRPGGAKVDDLLKELVKLRMGFGEKDPYEVRHRWLETTGTGSSKKRAKTQAAFNMLGLLEARITGDPEASLDIGNRLTRLNRNEVGTSTAVSQLQEYCQKYVRFMPEYEEGPTAGTTFTVVCRLQGRFSGVSGGEGETSPNFREP